MVCRLRWKKPWGLSSEGTARHEKGLSANDASLKSALKMSRRSPSTPSASQCRTVVEHGRLDPGVAVVEVRLEPEEARPVPLVRGRVVVPAAAAEHRLPVVGRRLAPRTAPVAPDVEVAPRVLARALRLEEPRVPVRRVVQDHVEDDLHPARVHRRDELTAVVHRAVLRRDGVVVAHVVAEVGLRALEERRQPERLDAQVLQVVELAQDAAQIADAVAAVVGEGARVDLVGRRALPPGHGRGAADGGHGLAVTSVVPIG